MDGVISVIVPVYNVEKYLPACLDSILAQIYDRLQILVIDDGSTDGSGAICDAYAEKDSRITVIHQKNGGAAAAKNAGLRMATGEYLAFVDSDDYLEPDAYAYMHTLLQSRQADAVQCGFRNVFREHTDDKSVNVEGRFSAEEYLHRYTVDWTCSLLWDKLFRRSLFDGIFFEENHKIDDEYFTYQGLMQAGAVVTDSHIVYNYRQRLSGVMLSPKNKKQILSDRIDYLSKRRIRVIGRFPALRQAFDRHYLEMLVILSRQGGDISQLRRSMKAYFREKGHTPADVRLWPALLGLRLGIRPKQEREPAGQADSGCYFE